MRRFALTALLVSLAVGCSRSSPTTAPEMLTQQQLDDHASKFGMKDPAPAPGELPLQYVDINGNAVDLTSYHNKSNVVLVVVRGVPKGQHYARTSCVGCVAQVNAMAAHYNEFTKRGAEVLVVYPGPTDTLPGFLADAKVDGAGTNTKAPFPLLSDKELKVVKALGIDGDWARPSTYILDKQGNVVFAYVGTPGASYDRPPLKAVLDQLDKLNAKK